MNLLALTHAHLRPDGLSPVSCERVDSLVSAWASDLKWNIDVVYTQGTKWRGIWPDGKGLQVHIITQPAPAGLMFQPPVLFSEQVRSLLAQKRFGAVASLAAARITGRIRKSLSDRGLALPEELVKARQWARVLLGTERIRQAKYDLIFVSAGYGDEYLLQTALTLSQQLKIPMVVDFRDLWSEHHDPLRFTEEQKKIIHQLEKELLVNTILISAPQKHMVHLLKQWNTCPVYHLSHSAYVGPHWEDGKTIQDEFTLVYAGKLYATAPGLKMLMEYLQKLSKALLYKPLRCIFFVDDTAALKKAAAEYQVTELISVHEWVSPAELWKSNRSAHLLLIPDPGLAENFPFISTKTFQLAYTGRQILCLSKYGNPEMDEFLHKHHAGINTTNVDEAVAWSSKLSFEKSQYEHLPQLRNILQREQAAIDFGREIENVMHAAPVV